MDRAIEGRSHRSGRALVGLGLLLTAVFGCQPVPPVPPPQAPAVAKAEPPPPAPARVTLPEETLAVFRWREPNALLRSMDAWSAASAGFESGWQRWQRELGASIDGALPVEGFVVLDRASEPPALRWVLSFPLAAGGFAATQRAPEAESVSRAWACVASSALGVAPQRLVCAETRADLESFLPAATRALPLVALRDAPVALSLSTAPLARLDAAEVKRLALSVLQQLWPVEPMNERFAEQLDALAVEVGGELASLAADLDGTVLDLSASAGEPALALRITTLPSAVRSRSLQLLVGSGAVGIVPTSLWDLHRESRRAAFWWSFRPEPLAELRAPLSALLGTVLDFRGVPLRLQVQARSLLENLPLPRAPLLFAEGRGSGAEPALVREGEAEGGWWMCQVEGELPEYRHYVAQLARAFDDPILGAQLIRLTRSIFGERWAPLRLVQRAPRHRGLPRDSFVLELEFRLNIAAAEASAEVAQAQSGPAAASFRRYLLFVPADPESPRDGGLKLAWGDDEALLTTLVASGRAGLKPMDTLAARTGLTALSQQRALAGGFASLEVLLAALEPAPSADATGSKRGPFWTAAPHGALGPIVYRVSPSTDTGGLIFDARLGIDTLEDVKYLVSRRASDEPAR